MITPINNLWKHRKVLVTVVSAELRKKYSGSVLGLAWLVIYPMIFLAIYSGVYLYIFKVRIPEFSDWKYVLIVFSGLVPYIGFCDALQQSSQSLVSHSHLLKNTVFPVELIPVKTVLCSQLAHAATLVVLFSLCLVSGFIDARYFWLAPFLFTFHLLLVLGLGWILSSLSVILRDIQYLLNLALLLMLFVSPIAFMPEMVPAPLRFLLYFNPLYYLISLYRLSFFGGAVFQLKELAVLGAASLAVFYGGYLFFNRFKEIFAEYV